MKLGPIATKIWESTIITITLAVMVIALLWFRENAVSWLQYVLTTMAAIYGLMWPVLLRLIWK